MNRDFNTRLPTTTQKCYNLILTFGRGKGKVRGKGNVKDNDRGKVNGKVFLLHTMNTYGGVEVLLRSFLALAVDKGQRSASRSTCFTT